MPSGIIYIVSQKNTVSLHGHNKKNACYKNDIEMERVRGIKTTQQYSIQWAFSNILSVSKLDYLEMRNFCMKMVAIGGGRIENRNPQTDASLIPNNTYKTYLSLIQGRGSVSICTDSE